MPRICIAPPHDFPMPSPFAPMSKAWTKPLQALAVSRARIGEANGELPSPPTTTASRQAAGTLELGLVVPHLRFEAGNMKQDLSFFPSLQLSDNLSDFIIMIMSSVSQFSCQFPFLETGPAVHLKLVHLPV